MHTQTLGDSQKELSAAIVALLCPKFRPVVNFAWHAVRQGPQQLCIDDSGDYWQRVFTETVADDQTDQEVAKAIYRWKSSGEMSDLASAFLKRKGFADKFVRFVQASTDSSHKLHLLPENICDLGITLCANVEDELRLNAVDGNMIIRAVPVWRLLAEQNCASFRDIADSILNICARILPTASQAQQGLISDIQNEIRKRRFPKTKV